jgi:hypothetical protein
MSLVAKIALVLALLNIHVAHARDLRILVLGEAAAANCNSRLYEAQPGVFQVGLDGAETPARDPLEWADCKGGSVWVPLGREIVRSRMADKVVFMSLGIPGSRARDWVKGGRAYAKLESAMRLAHARKIKFDYVFWYQGMSDGAARAEEYQIDLIRVVRFMIPMVPGVKWLFASSANCRGEINERILAAQRKVGSNALFSRFPGPDTNVLPGHSWTDQCTLTEDGQENMATLWLRSLVNSEVASQKYEREDLLHFFK